MHDFFILEGAYIIIGLFALAITLFVTTRPFMSKGAVKKGISSVFIVIAILIGTHFIITKNRMNKAKVAFNAGKSVLCENRVHTKAAQFVTIKKEYDWHIEGDEFKSPNYTRGFHLSRCIVEK